MRIYPAFLCCAVLAGCSRGIGSTPPLPTAVVSDGAAADAALRRPSSDVLQTSTAALQPPLTDAFTKFHYSFKGAPHDGAQPLDSLIAVGGALYGTTNAGGTYGYGTAYKINLSSGSETVLHSFGSGTDGRSAQGRLINVGGTLYGTTSDGGTYGNGTVFKLSPSGSSYSEKVLYSFKNGSDGNEPYNGLIEAGGKLYGATFAGGTDDLGTLFEVSTTGAESVIHSFGRFDSSGAPDGYFPRGNLVDVDGTFYGTTSNGGSGSGSGTVFSFNPSNGAERVLHNFSFAEGSPYVGLVAVDGTLYGNTVNGGSAFKGTIFSLKPGGAEKTLYSFAGGSDGASPDATLLYANGLLYGTTDAGGSDNNGTVFKINTAGTAEIVLHRFTGGIDGSLPGAGVIDLDGAIFGTTEEGGSGGKLDGTVYKLPL